MLLCVQLDSGMNYFSGDDVVQSTVNDILETLDYMDLIDEMEWLIETMAPRPPPQLTRQSAGPLEIIDLTSDDPVYETLPIATRLDFGIIVDEVENGGLFGRS